jgi:hypothetical protein
MAHLELDPALSQWMGPYNSGIFTLQSGFPTRVTSDSDLELMSSDDF